MGLHRQRPADGFDRQAFGVSERARARTLLDLIAESRSNIREGVDPALRSREQTLRAQLTLRRNDSDERVQSLLIQFRELQNEMRAKNPRYASLVEPPVADLDTVQRDLLDRDTALVEYALGEERSYVWIVDATRFTAHELPPRARIEALARRAHDALSRAQAPDLRVALQELSDAIVTPLGARIAGKRLAIVTEGTLQYIPFAALPDTDGRPLIASHEIVSLPSASTLRALRADAPRAAASRSVFVVGDPVFDGKDPRVRSDKAQPTAAPATALERSARDSGVAGLERLLFTRREADTIASLVPAARVRKLLDFDASLERITSGDLSAYRIVHFATHGLLNNKHPELSGLVFSLVDAQGRPRNGFLPAYEAYNLRLNAELVVLSACQTALGEDIRGEGLVGLTRAFMYAGTPRVVASLWRVPDSATAALMARFYRALLTENRRPAEALRLAQESVRAERRWSAPYYWAGFTLAGEWK
jgi:CHAT domain-containing protein